MLVHSSEFSSRNSTDRRKSFPLNPPTAQSLSFTKATATFALQNVMVGPTDHLFSTTKQIVIGVIRFRWKIHAILQKPSYPNPESPSYTLTEIRPYPQQQSIVLFLLQFHNHVLDPSVKVPYTMCLLKGRRSLHCSKDSNFHTLQPPKLGLQMQLRQLGSDLQKEKPIKLTTKDQNDNC